MNKKIGIIGRSAYGSNLCDGQTIKTRVLIEELKATYPFASIYIADTYQNGLSKIKLFFNIINCIRKSDVVFVLLSKNGRRVIFPILCFLNCFYQRVIIHDCIGGYIGKEVSNNSTRVRQLNSFTVNFAESQNLVNELKAVGVKNAEYLPNFKRLDVQKRENINTKFDEFYFCTFSRVCESKGIIRGIYAVKLCREKLKMENIYLDIYGSVEENFKEQFFKEIEINQNFVRYRGVVDYTKSVSVLTNYYMLLFPTAFEGEGFPGTLIDTLSAGLPVIASDWNLNAEIITDNKTGFIYDPNTVGDLESKMIYAIQNSDIVNRMRINCLDEVEKYRPETVMKKISKFLS